jgi:ComF family protein
VRVLRRLAALGRRVASDLQALALPHECPGCGVQADPIAWLCPTCRAAIPRLSIAVCARCLASGRDPVGCRIHPGFAVWPAWLYVERTQAIVHALKFQGCWRVAGSLGAELARPIAHLGRVDAVIPVPLHPARERERGYNQAGLLAAVLSARLRVPRWDDAMVRDRPTREQARLDAESRRRNVSGAFRIRNAEWLNDRRVLVVDDVITTGATLESCLAELHAAGTDATGVALAWSP